MPTPLSRRVVLGATTAAAAAVALPTLPTLSARAADPLVPNPPSGPEYGFTLSGDVTDPVQLQALLADIDALAALGITWVRVGIDSWHVAELNADQSAIRWKSEGIAPYETLFSRIRDRGLKLHLLLVQGQGHGQPNYWLFKYRTDEYWRGVANRLKELQVTPRVVQFFNEADGWDFFTAQQSWHVDRAEYLTRLRDMLWIGRLRFKEVFPDVVTTTNSTGWPVSDAQEQKWLDYFQQILISVDAVSLDLYPDDNMAEIERLPERVKRAADRFGKPVMIGEIGMSTGLTQEGKVRFTAKDQALYLAAALARLQDSVASQVCCYQFRDRLTAISDGERQFGLVTYDGVAKDSLRAVVAAMRGKPGIPLAGRRL